MSDLQGAALHVLHAVEQSEYDPILPSSVPAKSGDERHAAARSQIETELKHYRFPAAPNIIITNDEPSAAILQQIENEGIELLVMGTIARTGVSGVITGNTAEQLLPSVSCSILAVKPQDFESPVRLEATRE
jgi:universal stress protein E